MADVERRAGKAHPVGDEDFPIIDVNAPGRTVSLDGFFQRVFKQGLTLVFIEFRADNASCRVVNDDQQIRTDFLPRVFRIRQVWAVFDVRLPKGVSSLAYKSPTSV